MVRTLIGETLGRQHIQQGPVDEILGMACSPPSTDSSVVSLSEPNPLKCQLPVSRVSKQCREYCQRTMSAQAIPCQNDCRKYLLMTDTHTGDAYRGFSNLVRYLLAPSGLLARVTFHFRKRLVRNARLNFSLRAVGTDVILLMC